MPALLVGSENGLAVIATHWQVLPETRALDAERAAFFLWGVAQVAEAAVVEQLRADWRAWTGQALDPVRIGEYVLTMMTGESYPSTARSEDSDGSSRDSPSTISPEGTGAAPA